MLCIGAEIAYQLTNGKYSTFECEDSTQANYIERFLTEKESTLWKLIHQPLVNLPQCHLLCSERLKEIEYFIRTSQVPPLYYQFRYTTWAFLLNRLDLMLKQ